MKFDLSSVSLWLYLNILQISNSARKPAAYVTAIWPKAITSLPGNPPVVEVEPLKGYLTFG